MILSATRLLGWKVVTKGTLSIVMLFAASLFKISVLDLVDACSLPLLMRSFGYPRAFLAASMSNRSTDLTQSEKLTIRYGWLAIVRMGRTEVQVRVTIRGFVMYRSGYAITLRLHADIQERKFVRWDWPCTLVTEVKRGGNRRNWRRSSSLSLAYKISNCLSANHNPELWSVIWTGVTVFAPVLQFLHWCYSFCSCCTGVTVFAPVLQFLHWC